MWKSFFDAFCRVFACRCHSDCDLSTGGKVSTPKNAKTVWKTSEPNDPNSFQQVDISSADQFTP